MRRLFLPRTTGLIILSLISTLKAGSWNHQNMAWVLGPDGTSIRSPYEPEKPTAISWSIVPGNTGDAFNAGRYTQPITSLGVSGLNGLSDYDYIEVLAGVIDQWTEVSGITNLGYVEEDGSVLVGGVIDTDDDGVYITDRGPEAGIGHIRFMAYTQDDLNGSSAYAGATYIPEPGSNVDNRANHTKAGDIRFRSDGWQGPTIWEQGDYALHFRNIAMHEVGHILGFGHNSIAGSVMSSPYTEWNLGNGDIEGAIAIYGPMPEPEPCTPQIVGDLNCDGAVNLSDLALLAQHWLD